MEEKDRLDNDALKAVAGGDGDGHGPKYKFGDRVMLDLYPEYGTSTVQSVYLEGTAWKCSVLFEAGTVDASEDEFDPA